MEWKMAEGNDTFQNKQTLREFMKKKNHSGSEWNGEKPRAVDC